MTVQPSEAETGQPQFVQVDLTLVFHPAQNIPEISLTLAKGISERALVELQSTLDAEASSLEGEPMLFALFELAKSELQDSLPSERCSICLGQFTSPKGIFQSPCFHFVHDHCFANYAQHCIAVAKEDAIQRVREGVAPHAAQSGAIGQALLRGDAVECPVCRAPFDIVGVQLEAMVK